MGKLGGVVRPRWNGSGIDAAYLKFYPTEMTAAENRKKENLPALLNITCTIMRTSRDEILLLDIHQLFISPWTLVCQW